VVLVQVSRGCQQALVDRGRHPIVCVVPARVLEHREVGLDQVQPTTVGRQSVQTQAAPESGGKLP
jgi:hypothetical protein